MSSLVDSHCHLYYEPYINDIQGTINECKKYNINKLLTIGVDIATSKKNIELAKKYSEIYCTIGIHPNSTTFVNVAELCSERRVLEALKSPPAIVSKGDVHIGFNPIYEYSALPDHERVVNAIESILGTALKSSLEAAKWSEQLDAPAAPIQTPAGEAEPTMNSALSMDQKMK